ncbi:MAG: glycosyl transferase [Candidatus Dadabacteria bacterium]|nr:MAG: glycosyl transferase [Candidatus Dadabacteria bacterium]
MSDFFQNGPIATFHNLTNRPVESLEGEIRELVGRRPVALVLPSLFEEIGTPALDKIVAELSNVDYLTKIVIGLDRANEAEFQQAREYFARLPQRTWILWNDGPRLSNLREELADRGLYTGEPGKGRNVWMCYGFVLAVDEVEVVALHDGDILTYDRSLLARLIYPALHRAFPYEFTKAYFSRIGGGRLHGRVARLFVTPLIRALRMLFPTSKYLEYMDAFRYPLAGEMSIGMGTLSTLRIPSDWGLEIGLLTEMYRNLSVKQICQVDISDNYEHKHKPLDLSQRSSGLGRMAEEIAKSLFRSLAAIGYDLQPARFQTIRATYYRQALEMLERYERDASMNGLALDLHMEEQAIELFTDAIMDAGERFIRNPRERALIPSWRRVRSAVPDIYERFREAVELDNAD